MSKYDLVGVKYRYKVEELRVLAGLKVQKLAEFLNKEGAKGWRSVERDEYDKVRVGGLMYSRVMITFEQAYRDDPEHAMEEVAPTSPDGKEAQKHMYVKALRGEERVEVPAEQRPIEV